MVNLWESYFSWIWTVWYSFDLQMGYQYSDIQVFLLNYGCLLNCYDTVLYNKNSIFSFPEV